MFFSFKGLDHQLSYRPQTPPLQQSQTAWETTVNVHVQWDWRDKGYSPIVSDLKQIHSRIRDWIQALQNNKHHILQSGDLKTELWGKKSHSNQKMSYDFYVYYMIFLNQQK